VALALVWRFKTVLTSVTELPEVLAAEREGLAEPSSVVSALLAELAYAAEQSAATAVVETGAVGAAWPDCSYG